MSNEDLADTQKSIIQLQRKIKFDWKDMDLEKTILGKATQTQEEKRIASSSQVNICILICTLIFQKSTEMHKVWDIANVCLSGFLNLAV